MEGGRERKRDSVNGMQNDVYPINIRVGTYIGQETESVREDGGRIVQFSWLHSRSIVCQRTSNVLIGSSCPQIDN